MDQILYPKRSEKVHKRIRDRNKVEMRKQLAHTQSNIYLSILNTDDRKQTKKTQISRQTGRQPPEAITERRRPLNVSCSHYIRQYESIENKSSRRPHLH